MARTIYELCKRAITGTGLPMVDSIVTANDDMTDQISAFCYETAEEMIMLMRKQGQRLIRPGFIFLQAQDSQGKLDVLFPDMLSICADTVTNTTTGQKLIGPVDQQTWAMAKGSVASGALRNLWRIRDNELLVYGPNAVGNRIDLEYESKAWVRSNDGLDRRDEIKADNDFIILPETAFVLGVRWRFRDANGLAYDEPYKQYYRAIDSASSAERPARQLSLSPRGRWKSDFDDSNNVIIKV
jgi:hypothetical protein